MQQAHVAEERRAAPALQVVANLREVLHEGSVARVLRLLRAERNEEVHGCGPMCHPSCCTRARFPLQSRGGSGQPRRRAAVSLASESLHPFSCLHSMHCPGIGSSCSQIDRGRRMTVNATFRSCAR
jgi:hypothetical protein